jgi:hypothetical protein
MHLLSDISGSHSGVTQYSSVMSRYANRQTSAVFSEQLCIFMLYAAAQHVFLNSFTLKIKALQSSETSVSYLPIDMV